MPQRLENILKTPLGNEVIKMLDSKIKQTIKLGVDFWNDSCNLQQLRHAVEEGAVGATSNPVIVYDAVREQPEVWIPVLDQIIKDNPSDSEDEIAWKLIKHVAIKAAALLQPVYEKTNGKKGYLCVQVSPKYYRCAKRMTEHAKELASIAPNIAIKCPATETGIEAIEDVTAAGININATVSFSIPQVIHVAEAMERGIEKAKSNGINVENLHPYITIMVGRVNDQLRRVMAEEKITIDPSYIEWSGVIIFKKAYEIFKKRNYNSTLLAAAYRNHMQWSQMIGDNLILTIPYQWWNQFNESDITVERTIDKPVDQNIIDSLCKSFKDFDRIYREDGMKPAEFVNYGASVHTLKQFLGGYQQLLETVRDRMF